MLGGELHRKTDQQLQEAFRFWGASRREQLLLRFGDRLRFLEGCARLAPAERAVLLHLLLEKRPLARHQIRGLLGGSSTGYGENGGEGVVERLASRMLVVLRRDRAQLTDRNDRVYLVREAEEQLAALPLMEREEFQRLLGERINPPGTVTRCDPELQDIMLRGGFVELPPPAGPADRRINGFYEQGLLELLLVHDGCTVLPVLALAGRALGADRAGEHPAAMQSLYLYRLTILADCLSCRNLERKNRARNVELCLREAGGRVQGERYLDDLEGMGVVRRRQDRLEVDASFLSRDYQEKLALVDTLLSEGERRILRLMQDLGAAGRPSLMSLLSRERLLESLFSPRREPAAGREGEEDALCLDRLLFRGFLVRDHTGGTLLYNDLRPAAPARGSLIVNNDMEILVYPERISFHTLHLLACFCRVAGEEQAIRLKMDRDSVTRGMAVSGDERRFVETLEACSRNPLDESVVTRVRQWAGRCATAGVRSRLVLELSTEEARARFHRNSYLRRNLEREADGLVVLSPRVDPYRLKRELRRENILAHFER
jgi:hypothetical protein